MQNFGRLADRVSLRKTPMRSSSSLPVVVAQPDKRLQIGPHFHDREIVANIGFQWQDPISEFVGLL